MMPHRHRASSILRLFSSRRLSVWIAASCLAALTAVVVGKSGNTTAQAQDYQTDYDTYPEYDSYDDGNYSEYENGEDEVEEILPDQPAVCSPLQGSGLPFTELQSGVMQAANWFGQPEAPIESVLQTIMPSLVAQFTPSPWPSIHDRARLAKVPILMYHDILAEKEVFFDVTPEEFEAHLQLIQQNDLTPISMDQLVNHLQTGLPLPEKPILLTFDDGYLGHYQYVLPLLQKYNYPGLFSIYTYKVGREHGRPSVSWEQLEEMAADPLVTIAAHSVNHPPDLRELSDADLEREIVDSKQELESKLGIPMRYFSYPEGKYDQRVADAVRDAGFLAALTMNDLENRTAGESSDLLAIDRIGQSQIAEAIELAWGGAPLKPWGSQFDFVAEIQVDEATVDDIPLTLISGGRPVTIHADSRYQVWEITQNTGIQAAVDGGFFSLEYLDSNQMIGPVFSQNTGEFVPGDRNDVPFLKNRPMVMISANAVQFIPFDPAKHNTLAGVQAEMSDVTDAFVAAAWLVKDGQAQPAETFGSLFDYDAARHRAFWGINQAGQPVVGVSHDFVDSIHLGEILAQLGLQDAVMLDSGASTSLSYEDESLVGYEPRPVPHIVGLLPAASANARSSPCLMAAQEQP